MLFYFHFSFLLFICFFFSCLVIERAIFVSMEKIGSFLLASALFQCPIPCYCCASLVIDMSMPNYEPATISSSAVPCTYTYTRYHLLLLLSSSIRSQCKAEPILQVSPGYLLYVLIGYPVSLSSLFCSEVNILNSLYGVQGSTDQSISLKDI